MTSIYKNLSKTTCVNCQKKCPMGKECVDTMVRELKGDVENFNRI